MLLHVHQQKASTSEIAEEFISISEEEQAILETANCRVFCLMCYTNSYSLNLSQITFIVYMQFLY